MEVDRTCPEKRPTGPSKDCYLLDARGKKKKREAQDNMEAYCGGRDDRYAPYLGKSTEDGQ